MQYVLLGALAFPLLMPFDWLALRDCAWPKNLLLLVGGIAFIGGSYRAILAGSLISISPPLSFVGWAMTGVSTILLFYSLIIEIPFTTTYLSPSAPSQVVSTGTYALTRHPDIIWMAVLLTGVVLVSRSATFVVAAFVWWS